MTLVQKILTEKNFNAEMQFSDTSELALIEIRKEALQALQDLVKEHYFDEVHFFAMDHDYSDFANCALVQMTFSSATSYYDENYIKEHCSFDFYPELLSKRILIETFYDNTVESFIKKIGRETLRICQLCALLGGIDIFLNAIKTDENAIEFGFTCNLLEGGEPKQYC